MSPQLFFENKKYISAKDASILTGYAQDYVGQLCRQQKIDSKKVGAIWYVSEEAILNYNKTPAPIVPESSLEKNFIKILPIDTFTYFHEFAFGLDLNFSKHLLSIALSLILTVSAYAVFDDIRGFSVASKTKFGTVSSGLSLLKTELGISLSRAREIRLDDISRRISSAPTDLYNAMAEVSDLYANGLKDTVAVIVHPTSLSFDNSFNGDRRQAAVATLGTPSVSTAVDQAGVVVYNKVNNFFDTTIYGPLASFFGQKNTTLVVVSAPTKKVATSSSPVLVVQKPVMQKPQPTSPVPVITKIIERVVQQSTPQSFAGFITQSDLELRLSQFDNAISSKFYGLSTGNGGSVTNIYQQIANSQRIDQLTGTVITNPAISGGTISGTNISGGSISGAAITGGSISTGSLTANALTISTTTAGCAQFSITGELFSTTANCGTGGGSGGGTFSTTTSSVLGRLINRPNNNTDIVAIGGSSTTTAKYWFDPNTSISFFTGNVGIGSSSPYAMLSVAGGVVAGSYVATTSATSTFAGGIAANIFNATSVTASSTFANGINLTTGCFAINGTCVGGSSFTNTLASGGTATTTFYNGGVVFSDGSKLTQTAAASSFFWDNTNRRLGLGTNSPNATLAIQASANGTVPLNIVSQSGTYAPKVQFVNSIGNTWHMGAFSSQDSFAITRTAQRDYFEIDNSGGTGTITFDPNITGSTVFASGNVRVDTLTPSSVVFTDLSKNLTSSGTVPVSQGGTGITTPSAAGVLLGNYAGTGYQQIATSSLGLLTTNVAEGSNLYYTDARVQAFVHASTTIPKTYTTNSWSALQQFNAGASTTQLSAGLAYFGTTATSSFSSTGALTLAGSFNGPLQANNGVVSATTSVGVVYGGTGLTSYTSGDILYADTNGNLAKLAKSTDGLVLKLNAGFPSWQTDLTSGGGGGATAWATSTNSMIIYPTNTTNILVVGSNATTTTGNIFEVVGNSLFGGNVKVNGELLVTSSTTLQKVGFTNATSSTFAITSLASTLLKVNANGSIIPAVAGTDYQAAGSYITSAITALGPIGQTQTGATQTLATSTNTTNGLTAALTIIGSGNTQTFTPSLSGILTAAGGGTGITTPSAAGVLLGNYAGTGYQQIATSSLGLLTTNVAEGSNLYFTSARADARINATTSIGTLTSLPNLSLPATQLTNFGTPFYQFFSATTTDALAQGAINKYYSDTLVQAFVHASTTIPKTYTTNSWSALQQFNAGASTTQLSAGLAYFGTTATSSFSSTGALTLAGSFNGPLQANNGVVSATTSVGVVYGGTGATTAAGARTNLGAAASGANSDITSLGGLTTALSVPQGGTGWTAVQANTLLFGNGSGALATTSAGTNGFVLAFVNGVPTWQATTTLSTISGTLAVSNGGTATTTFYNGGVVFSDGTKLTQSSAASNFFWDNTNNKLGLGTSTPFAQLSVNSIAGQAAFVVGSSTATSFIVDKNGNVGVGTTTPSARLAIQGITGAANIPFEVASSTGLSMFRINANSSLQGGLSSTASGLYSISFGKSNSVTTQSGVALGESNSVSNIYGVALGSFNTVNNNTYGVALGASNTSGGYGAVSAGYGNTALGSNANLSLGWQNYVGGGVGGSAAIGYNNVINGGTGSVALGAYTTIASGGAGVGQNLNVTGTNSFAFGSGPSTSVFLTNSISNSMMLGVNSTVPTLYISQGYSTTTSGGVGIGTTTPVALLSLQNVSTSTLPLFDIASSSGTSFVRVNANGNVGIGTTSPYSMLSVAGTVVANNYIATSTATSTFTGGIAANIFNATSATASSTFANGINVTSGCFAVNGACLGSGTSIGAGITSATQGSVLFAGAGGVLSQNNANFFWDNTNARFGLGTTSPFAQLSINPNGVTGAEFAVGSSTKTDLIVTNGGNVGVGTSNPNTASRLHVLATPTDNAALILDTGASTNPWAIQFSRQGASSAYVSLVSSLSLGWQASLNPITDDGIYTLGTAGLRWNSIRVGTGSSVFDGAVSLTSTLGVTGASTLGTLTTTNATSSTFAITSLASTLVKANASGSLIPAIAGTDYSAALAFTYPIVNSANTISLAFGTTTANSWSALQQFNSGASTTQLTTTGSTYLATAGGKVAIGTTTSISTLALQALPGINPFLVASSTGSTLVKIDRTGNVLGASFSMYDTNNTLSSTLAAVTGGNGGISFADNISGGNYFTIDSVFHKMNLTQLAVSGSTVLANTTATSLTIASLNGPLQANNGVVSATSSVGILYGGTGATSFSPNSIITSNAAGTALIATGTQLTVGNLIATSTATSTFTGGIAANIFNATSATASSTFANGVNLSAGCFAINGTCVGGAAGSGTVGTGTTGQSPYYAANGTTLTATSSLFISTAGNIGIGTTSPSVGLHLNKTSAIFGTGELGTPADFTLRGATAVGTNLAGGNFYMDASNGTGSGGSGGFIFRTAPAEISSAPVIGGTTSFENDNTNAPSFTHVAGSGTSRMLLVVIANTSTSATASAVTYGGQSLTQITSQSHPLNTDRVDMWYLINPLTGSNTVAVTMTNYSRVKVMAIDVTGVSQTSPLGTAVTASGTDATPTVNVSSAVNELVVDVVTGNNGTAVPSVGAGQTSIFTSAQTLLYSGGSYKAGASSVTMSWTFNSSNNWVIAAVPIRGTGGAGANTLVERLRINSAGNVGIGTTTPGSLFSVQGIANFTTATSTFQSTGGINLTAGCFSVSGTCLSNFSNTLANGGTATTTFYNGGVVFSDGTKLTQSSAASNFFWDNTNNKLGLGTSTPFAQLSVNSIAGQAAFVVGSSTATSFIVDKNGNVGIGTTNPLSSLTLADSAGTDDATQQLTIGDNAGFHLAMGYSHGGSVPVGYLANNYTAPTSRLDFRVGGLTNASTRMAILANGNVGIGTSTPAQKLEIDVFSTSGELIPLRIAQGGAGQAAANLTTAVAMDFMLPTVSFNTGYTTAAKITAGKDVADWNTVGNRSSNLQFYTTLADTVTERMRINSSGRIGIGSTTPWAQLSVNSNALGSGVPEFAIGSSSATHFIVDGAGNVGIGTTTPWAQLSVNPNALGSGVPSFVIGSSTATQLIVLGNGNVGIGTSTPYSMLSVAGTVVANNYIATSTATSTFTGGIAANIFNATSATASSTFANGINLTAGCFSIGGSCIGAGSSFTNTLASGGTATTTFYNGGVLFSDGSKLTQSSAQSNFFWNETNKRFGIGTTTPNAMLTIQPSASNLMGLYVASTTGAPAFEVDGATGFTGVGTTTPWAQLSVNPTALGSGRPEFVIGSSTATHFLVNGTGQVAIGSSVFDSTNANVFTVQGTNTGGVTSATMDMEIIGSSVNGSPGLKFKQPPGGSQYNFNIGIDGNNNGQLYITRAGARDLQITSAGKVGIGLNTTQAVNLLDVLGGVGIGSYAGVNGAPTNGLIVSGNVGIGTTTPWAQLSVNPTALGSGVPEFVVGSSTATHFIVNGSGNVGIGTTSPWRTLSVDGTVSFKNVTASIGAGSLCLTSSNEVVYNAGSDACLSSLRATKHNISDLTVHGLDMINALNSVSFIYNDGDGRTRYGFIAEDAAAVDEHFATHNVNGDITGIDDRSIISVSVKAIQELNLNLETIASTTATSTVKSQAFATSFWNNLFARVTGFLADAANGIGDVFANTFRAKEKICVDDQCLTKDDVKALLQMAHSQVAAPVVSASGGSSTLAPAPTQTLDTEAPVVTLNGNNPATVQVGSSYADLGATVTDNVNHNLGYTITVDGGVAIDPSQFSLDTSVPVTYTLTFNATDGAGNIGTATRTVIIEDLHANATTTMP